jgi:hypothetical protein
MTGKLLKCKISRYNKALFYMGIDQTIWVDFTIQADTIVAVKSDIADDGDEGAVIYTQHGDSFITNMTYEEVLNEITNL